MLRRQLLTLLLTQVLVGCGRSVPLTSPEAAERLRNQKVEYVEPGVDPETIEPDTPAASGAR